MLKNEFCKRCSLIEDKIIALIKEYDSKRLGAHSLIRKLKRFVDYKKSR